MRRGNLALAFVSIALSGCSAAGRAWQDDRFPGLPVPDEDFEEQRAEPETSYFQARVDDFLDAFSVRLLLGPGIGVRAAATKLLQVGMLYRGPARDVGRILALKTLAIGNTGREIGIWDVRSTEYGLLVWYSYYDDVIPFASGSGEWRGSYDDRPPTALEVAVHLGLFGATLSFDPWSLGKFVGGIFGFGDAGWFD